MIRIIMSALLAGVLAGMLVFVGHSWKVTPLIVNAEVYETVEPESHSHSHVTNNDMSKAAAHEAETKHSHSDGSEWTPEDGFERSAFTLLSDVTTAIGFAFLLGGAMVLSGRELGWKRGMVWGLCGYAALYLAPAFGLSPELPGMASADLTGRQGWWLITAMATAGGLGCLFFSSRSTFKVIAVMLLLAPHLIGAPHPVIKPSAVPAELAAQFAVATLVITAMFWLFLGAMSGYFLDRFKETG